MSELLSGTAPNVWEPIVEVDLETVSKASFEEALEKFEKERQARKAAGTLPPLPFTQDGWYEVTPEQSEALLLRSAGNRKTDLRTVKAYDADMAEGDWLPTSQAIGCSEDDLDDGHHRSWASYLGGHIYRTYVIVSVPKSQNLFAYLDSGKKRSSSDALYTAGWNGAGSVLSKTIEDLAIRFDHNALAPYKLPRFNMPKSPRVTMAYLAQHQDLRDAAHRMLDAYPDAVTAIGSKPAAVMFAWLVLRVHGPVVLDEFCKPLGSGARLDEDSPILAVRNKLMIPVFDANGNKQKLSSRLRLAYVSKAFLMYIAGEKMPRDRKKGVHPLVIDATEKFPRIEFPLAEAAE